MSDDILKSIDKRLTTITNLIAINAIKDKPLNEQINILYNAHLNINEIAAILGKSPNNISVRLHQKKMSEKKSEQQKPEAQGEKVNGDDVT